MDLHKAEDYEVKPTIDEIKSNHIADLETQAKYNVRFIQYWINEEAGLVFCLMEAPDKESCIATHQEAHGNMPCNVIELKGGDYTILMGQGIVNDSDITEEEQGIFDPGTRSFIAVDIIAPSRDPYPVTRLQEIVQGFKGRNAGFKNGRVKFVFNSASTAVACATAIRNEFKNAGIGNELRIAVSAGDPVTTNKSIFADALELVDWLCDISSNGQITVSSHAQTLHSKLSERNPNPDLKLLTRIDETFLKTFMKVLEPRLPLEQTGVNNLCVEIGISQAQLYRKVTKLTGKSPNAFIHELRLRNALRLVDQEFGNVTEIAFATGFNSPSYFTKSFKKRFGTSPANL